MRDGVEVTRLPGEGDVRSYQRVAKTEGAGDLGAKNKAVSASQPGLDGADSLARKTKKRPTLMLHTTRKREVVDARPPQITSDKILVDVPESAIVRRINRHAGISAPRSDVSWARVYLEALTIDHRNLGWCAGAAKIPIGHVNSRISVRIGVTVRHRCISKVILGNAGQEAEQIWIRVDRPLLGNRRGAAAIAV